MKNRCFVTIAVAVLLAAGTFAVAQAPTQPKPDARIDKVLEQNEQILKNQEQILKNQEAMQKALTTLQEGMIQLRRRSS